jgi:cell division initiation protein
MRDFIEISPLDIQQHQFHIRFRGFDIREVDEFLDQVARSMDSLYAENNRLKEENRSLEEANQRLTRQEQTAREQLQQTNQIMDQLTANAKTSAAAILSEAEQKAETIIQQAYNRLAQVHEDLIRLKTQRMQIESQIRAVIDSHAKLLDMENQQMLSLEQEYQKIRKIGDTAGKLSGSD